MAKKRNRRRRQHFCVPGFERKIDADWEAKIIRSAGHKASVKPDGRGWKVCRTMKDKRRTNVPSTLRGVDDRFVVSGPSRWKRSFHTSYDAAMKSGKKCSKQFPNAVCKVEKGLPGMQRTIAECNRDECWKVSGSMGRRRRRKTRRK